MSLSDENEKLSEEVGKLLILQLAEAKKRGCSIEGTKQLNRNMGKSRDTSRKILPKSRFRSEK